jgi:haloalkane dehalogenase
MTNFRPSPELYPFESRWFRSSAGRVHYIDEGSGRPLLFCHGNPTWSFLYRDVIKALRDDFRCVAVDYPGFGLSDRPDGYGYTPGEHAEVVLELVRDLDLGDLVTVGHDWGGPISLAVACADSDRIGGITLGGTWFWPSDFRARMFGRVMSTGPMQRAILERNMFVERFVPSGTNRGVSEEVMDHYRAVQATPEARVGIAVLPRQLTGAQDWLADLERDVPAKLGSKRALVTYPMKDAAFPAKPTIARFREAFADIEVVELPDAKHFFAEDAAGEVASAIARRFG